jgi:hypothetical protein
LANSKRLSDDSTCVDVSRCSFYLRPITMFYTDNR